MVLKLQKWTELVQSQEQKQLELDAETFTIRTYSQQIPNLFLLDQKSENAEFEQLKLILNCLWNKDLRDKFQMNDPNYQLKNFIDNQKYKASTLSCFCSAHDIFELSMNHQQFVREVLENKQLKNVVIMPMQNIVLVYKEHVNQQAEMSKNFKLAMNMFSFKTFRIQKRASKNSQKGNEDPLQSSIAKEVEKHTQNQKDQNPNEAEIFSNGANQEIQEAAWQGKGEKPRKMTLNDFIVAKQQMTLSSMNVYSSTRGKIMMNYLKSDLISQKCPPTVVRQQMQLYEQKARDFIVSLIQEWVCDQVTTGSNGKVFANFVISQWNADYQYQQTKQFLRQNNVLKHFAESGYTRISQTKSENLLNEEDGIDEFALLTALFLQIESLKK